MRNILSKPLQRRLHLIEYLFTFPQQKMSTLQKKLNYNAITLMKDISDINEMITPCEIIQTPNYEYTLFFPVDTNIEYVYSCFLKNSVEFSLLNKLIYQTFSSLESLSTELFVSPSTLRRLIRRINANLKSDYNFKISTSPVMFIGNDANIINFSSYFLKEFYLTPEKMLQSDQLELLNNLFKALSLSSRQLPISLLDVDKFHFYVYANLLRFKQIQPLEPIDQNLLLFPEFSSLKISFKRAFNVELTPSLILKMEALVNNDKFMFTYNELISSTISDKQKYQTVTLINNLIDHLCELLKIQCVNIENLSLTLYNFTTLTYGSEYILFSRYKFFLTAITDCYPLFFDSIQTDVKKILSYTNLEKSYEFVYHLLLHWPELKNALHKFNPKMNVAICFYTDIYHNYWMKQFLEEHFSDKLSIDVLYEKQWSITTKNLKNYDLLLTNQSLKSSDYDNVICCSIFPTDNQLANIHNFYISWLQNYK